MLQRVSMPVAVIEEVEGHAAVGLPQELSAGVEIRMGHVPHGLGGPQAARIVGVGHAGGAVRRRGKASAVLPSEGPTGAVVVAQGVADLVVGDGLAVIRRQQIPPLAVAVGIAGRQGTVLCLEPIVLSISLPVLLCYPSAD